MGLSIGVLIIGSLYWEPSRESWRRERLRMNEVFPVCAPIRYGRQSEKRGNTYTMVFSRGCEPGAAIVVRCKADVEAAADLITEAEHLWTAERNEAPNGRISANWGRVTLLMRPGADIPKVILDAWAARVAAERGYRDVPQAAGEGSLVSRQGILQITWPVQVDSGKDVPVDLLIATATEPSLTGQPPQYPEPERIAEAWRNDKADNVRYFRNNRKGGICTFQDEAINRLLNNGCLGSLAGLVRP